MGCDHELLQGHHVPLLFTLAAEVHNSLEGALFCGRTLSQFAITSKGPLHLQTMTLMVHIPQKLSGDFWSEWCKFCLQVDQDAEHAVQINVLNQNALED